MYIRLLMYWNVIGCGGKHQPIIGTGGCRRCSGGHIGEGTTGDRGGTRVGTWGCIVTVVAQGAQGWVQQQHMGRRGTGVGTGGTE